MAFVAESILFRTMAKTKDDKLVSDSFPSDKTKDLGPKAPEKTPEELAAEKTSPGPLVERVPSDNNLGHKEETYVANAPPNPNKNFPNDNSVGTETDEQRMQREMIEKAPQLIPPPVDETAFGPVYKLCLQKVPPAGHFNLWLEKDGKEVKMLEKSQGGAVVASRLRAASHQELYVGCADDK